MEYELYLEEKLRNLKMLITDLNYQLQMNTTEAHLEFTRIMKSLVHWVDATLKTIERQDIEFLIQLAGIREALNTLRLEVFIELNKIEEKKIHDIVLSQKIDALRKSISPTLLAHPDNYLLQNMDEKLNYFQKRFRISELQLNIDAASSSDYWIQKKFILEKQLNVLHSRISKATDDDINIDSGGKYQALIAESWKEFESLFTN